MMNSNLLKGLTISLAEVSQDQNHDLNILLSLSLVNQLLASSLVAPSKEIFL